MTVTVPIDTLIRWQTGVLADIRGYATPETIMLLEQTIAALQELKKIREEAQIDRKSIQSDSL